MQSFRTFQGIIQHLKIIKNRIKTHMHHTMPQALNNVVIRSGTKMTVFGKIRCMGLHMAEVVFVGMYSLVLENILWNRIEHAYESK